MSSKMIVVVPARGGSKRLINKNIMELNNKPLIAWSIESALSAFEATSVMVSTDSDEIASIAKDYGATVPWLRPKELSTDNSTTISVLKHAVDWYTNNIGPVDAVMLLQPTSPFRSRKGLKEAINAYNSGIKSSLVSVSQFRVSPYWALNYNYDKVGAVLGWEYFDSRSQDLPKCYHPNGSIYIIPTWLIDQGGPIIREDSFIYKMNNFWESVDIDDKEDFYFAEIIATKIYDLIN